MDRQINNKIRSTIGIFADTLKIHQRTLRIWDKEGILIPKRSSKNRRNYSMQDFEKAKLILFLTRNLAINLAGVKIILLFLKMNKVKPQQYINYINKIAKEAKINNQIQQSNIIKTSKRGRRKAQHNSRTDSNRHF